MTFWTFFAAFTTKQWAAEFNEPSWNWHEMGEKQAMKPVVIKVWIAGLMTAFCCSPLNAADLTIVQDGEPRAAIVTAGEPHAIKAAGEIRKYIEKISGARLPVVKEGEATARSRSWSAIRPPRGNWE